VSARLRAAAIVIISLGRAANEWRIPRGWCPLHLFRLADAEQVCVPRAPYGFRCNRLDVKTFATANDIDRGGDSRHSLISRLNALRGPLLGSGGAIAAAYGDIQHTLVDRFCYTGHLRSYIARTSAHTKREGASRGSLPGGRPRRRQRGARLWMRGRPFQFRHELYKPPTPITTSPVLGRRRSARKLCREEEWYE
jgi:hypothetical protein